MNKLGMIKNEYYCLGGPGVTVFGKTVSDHEDVELGRCIRKYAGVSCLRAREVSTLMPH